MRQMNIMALGFLLYADRGGIKVWNVGMVFAFFLGIFASFLFYAKGYYTSDNAPSCDNEFESFMLFNWIQTLWIALAFVASIMDSRMGDGGTAGENTPLVS